MNSKRILDIGTGLLAGILSSIKPALALNYYGLEVYPYKTASKGEFELENTTTFTDQGSKDKAAPDNNKGLTRSSFEAAYGITDHLEVAAYGDFSHARGNEWIFAGHRYRARMKLEWEF